MATLRDGDLDLRTGQRPRRDGQRTLKMSALAFPEKRRTIPQHPKNVGSGSLDVGCICSDCILPSNDRKYTISAFFDSNVVSEQHGSENMVSAPVRGRAFLVMPDSCRF